MPNLPFGFPWHVAKAGYRWERGRSLDNPKARNWFLMPVESTEADLGALHVYAPLREYSGLFRVLADTKPTFDGIRGFAHKFGLLRQHGLFSFIPLGRKGQLRTDELVGEASGVWLNEIRYLRTGIFLWDRLQNNDEAWLRSIIKWDSNDENFSYEIPNTVQADFDAEPIEGPFKGKNSRALLDLREERSVRRGDCYAAGRLALADLIDKGVRKNCKLRFATLEPGKDGLQAWPQGLLGAVWSQFADAVSRNAEYRCCDECGIWFELAPSIGRADKRYCSDGCRSAAYRKRQREAARLLSEGHNVQQIAKQLQSDVQTVRSWLKKAPPGGMPRLRGRPRKTARPR